MPPRKSPKDFAPPPSAQAAQREHPVALLAQEAAGGSGLPGNQELPERSELPGSSEPPERSERSGRSTRTSAAGETVERFTFWLTPEDSQLVEQLRRDVEIPGIPGLPDRSAVVRHCIRLAAEHRALAAKP